jgi:hypothetical protein
MILAWFLDLKFLYELTATTGRNFKSTTLEAKRRIVTAVTASAGMSCNQSGVAWLKAMFRIY